MRGASLLGIAGASLAALAVYVVGARLHEEDLADLLAQADFEREQREALRRAARLPSVRVAVDIGRQFTTLVAVDQRDGQSWSVSTPSVPNDPHGSLARGLECLERTGIPAHRLEVLVHGTSLALGTCPGLTTTTYLDGVERVLKDRGIQAKLLVLGSDGFVDTPKAFAALPVATLRSGSAGADIAARQLPARPLLTLHMGAGSARLSLIGAREGVPESVEVEIDGSAAVDANALLERIHPALVREAFGLSGNARELTLLATGGNGPLYAAELAAALGVSRILIPAAPAQFAAAGMLLASARYDVRQAWTAELPASGAVPGLEQALVALSDALAQAVASALGEQTELSFDDYAELRYRHAEQTSRVHLRSRAPIAEEAFDLAAFFTAMKEGRDLSVASAQPADIDAAEIAERFRAICADEPGASDDRRIEIVSLRVGCLASLGAAFKPLSPATPAMPPGSTWTGPCAIEQERATTLVPEGWTVRLRADQSLELTHQEGSAWPSP
jgi:N-methylhydantoinase A/oxoprolinase/acetone carboxylase beta subunit